MAGHTDWYNKRKRMLDGLQGRDPEGVVNYINAVGEAQMMANNPETTLEEVHRLRDELRGTRAALVALSKADEAYKATRTRMMQSPLSEAMDAGDAMSHLEQQREEAITLCVELGWSLRDVK